MRASLNRDVHFHVVVVDALFVVEGETLRIEHLPAPTDEPGHEAAGRVIAGS